MEYRTVSSDEGLTFQHGTTLRVNPVSAETPKALRKRAKAAEAARRKVKAESKATKLREAQRVEARAVARLAILSMIRSGDDGHRQNAIRLASELRII